MTTDQVVRLVVGVVLLLALTLAARRWAGLRLRAAAATALARGALQLAFVGLVLGGVLAGSRPGASSWSRSCAPRAR